MQNPILEARRILGVSQDAAPEAIRSRYLELVRQFPPEAAPERFQEIFKANELLSDPMKQAEAIWNFYNEPAPELHTVLDAESGLVTPRLPKLALLSLGN